MAIKYYTIFLLFFALAQFSYSQDGPYISMKQNTELLQNRKKSTSTLDLYFDKSKTTLTKYIKVPEEVITMTNRLGEIKIYYPSTNQVAYMQGNQFSAQRTTLYYFTNNQTDHLGLADEGFKLISRNYEGQYLVATWKSPAGMGTIDQVKMVFEGANPIYSEYISTKGDVLKKVFYTQYHDFYSFRMPLRITEISFQPTGDSIINRTIFSDVSVTQTPSSDYFNFKIPDDAQTIKKE